MDKYGYVGHHVSAIRREREALEVSRRQHGFMGKIGKRKKRKTLREVPRFMTPIL
jgi:hypothetical protein